MIIARAPFRITLGGGGTDLPSFYEKHGGFVLSMALDKYIYVCLKDLHMSKKVRLQYSKTEIVDSVDDLQHNRARRALKRHNMLHGYEIVSIADLPASSGLGSSGSYLVALLTAIRSYLRLPADPETVANEACEIEIRDLEEPVGKQDQYISAYGGIQELHISKSGNVDVKSAKVTPHDMSDLLSRLLHEHWENKKKMSNKISFGKVDNLYETARSDYSVLGGKIIGAGGGGFLMLYSSDKESGLQQFMESSGLIRLDYGVDTRGATIVNL